MSRAGHPTEHRPAPRQRPTGEARQVFTGEYRHSVDDKGRMAVPARFRTQLEDGAFVSQLARQLPRHLAPSRWEALAAKTAALPHRRTPDPAPSSASSSAGPSRSTSTARVGSSCRPTSGSTRPWTARRSSSAARDHAEIWAPARWDDVRRGLEDPETLAEHLDGLGI